MNKYTIEQVQQDWRSISRDILKKVYDKDDNVLLGSKIVKGKVAYEYIPAENMETGRPYLAFSSIAYDGKGNTDLPKDAIVMAFNELPQMFPDNTFA